MLGGSGRHVLGELGLDEASEDAEHLGRRHAAATRGLHAQGAVDVEDRRRAELVGHLVISLGPVEVGEHLPPAGDDAEVVEAKVFGVLQQDRQDRCELVGHSRVGAQPCQFVGLRGADVSGLERCTDLCVLADGAGETPQTGGVGGRPVGLGDDPLLHRSVSVECVQPPPLAFPHDGRLLGVERSTLELELPEPLRQCVVVPLRDLSAVGGVGHVTHCTNVRSRRIS